MRTSRAGSWSSRSGFTLVELALVVLLLSLFSVLSLPLLSAVGDDAMERSARRLAGTVKYLYNEAALSGLEYRIVYDLDDRSYRTRRLETDGELTEVGGSGRGRSLYGEVAFEDLTIPGRGTFQSGELTTRVLPIGWMEETLVHLRQDDRQMTLHLQPYTGTTKVYEGYRDLDSLAFRSR